MPFWTNKVGRPVRISEMSDEYLSNCIKMVERGYEKYVMNVSLSNKLNEDLSSIDEEYFTEDILNIKEKFPVYKDLVNELKSRKKMNNYEKQYLNILSNILEKGVYSKNRTGINTYKTWGAQMHIDLSEGFPLLTTKKMHLKSAIYELLWMIKGDTNIQYLLKNGVTFWTEWPYAQYKNWFETKGGNVSIYGKRDDGCRSARVYNQKEFEQTIITNDEFAKQWGSIGEYGYGGMWRKFPFHDNSDPMCHNTPTKHACGVELDTHYETSGGFACEVGHVDQLTSVINELKNNPDSRRIIITAWHPYHSNRKEDALLPACHNYIQFGTEELTLEERLDLSNKRNGILDDISSSYDKSEFGITHELDKLNIPKYRLNCYYSMRSNDFFLGNPYNNFFYALLTHLIANDVNMVPGKLVYTAADVHLYENHIEQSKLQLTREPKQLPKLNIKSKKSIFDIVYDDIEIIGYESHPAIKAEVAV